MSVWDRLRRYEFVVLVMESTNVACLGVLQSGVSNIKLFGESNGGLGGNCVYLLLGVRYVVECEISATSCAGWLAGVRWSLENPSRCAVACVGF